MAMAENRIAFVRRDPIVAGKEYARSLKNLKERFHRPQMKATVKGNAKMLELYWTMRRDMSEMHRHPECDSAFLDYRGLVLKEEFL